MNTNEPVTSASILLVDDDDDSCALVSLCLEREGWKVTQLSTIEAAVAALVVSPVTGVCPFDVLLTDLHLGDGEGTSLLVKGRPPGVRFAVIMSGDVIEAPTHDGFDAALLKPLDRTMLVNMIRASLIGPQSDGRIDGT